MVMVVLGIVVASTLALVQAPAPEPLVWHAPAACPDDAAMRAQVARWLGRPLDENEAAHAHGVVTTREREPGRPIEFELRLTVTTPEAAPLVRVLVDRDCSVLAEAAALSIAIVIDPEAAMRVPDELPPEPAPEPAVPPPVPVPVVVPPSREPAPAPAPSAGSRRTPVRCTPRPGRRKPGSIPCLAIVADVGLQVGTLPRVGPTVGGRLSAVFPRWVIGLGVQHLFAQPARVQSDPPKGGDIALTHAMLEACVRLGFRRAEFPLCGDLEAGAFVGRGVGVSTTATARVPWLAARVGAAAMIAPLRRLALGLRVDAVIPVVPYRFTIDGLGTVYKPGTIGARAGFVIEARLP